MTREPELRTKSEKDDRIRALGRRLRKGTGSNKKFRGGGVPKNLKARTKGHGDLRKKPKCSSHTHERWQGKKVG